RLSKSLSVAADQAADGHAMLSVDECVADLSLRPHLLVHELDALLLEGVDEIERGAVEIDEALPIDVDLRALHLEQGVLRPGLIAVLDHVAHPRAAAALHAQTDAALWIRLRAPGQLGLDLLRGAARAGELGLSHRSSSPRPASAAGRSHPSSSSIPPSPPLWVP